MTRSVIFVVVSVGLGLASATAGPLPPEQCTGLATALDQLDKAGVKALLEKGPAATRTSLTRDQRDSLRTYLNMLGEMRFRCPNEAPFVTLKQEPPEDPAETSAAAAPIEAGSPGITLPPGVAAAVLAPVAPKKPAVPKAAEKTAEPKPAKKQAPAKAVATPPAQAAPAAKPADAKPTPPVAAPVPQQAAAKPKPAAKPKVDDALRPATPADGATKAP